MSLDYVTNSFPIHWFLVFYNLTHPRLAFPLFFGSSVKQKFSETKVSETFVSDKTM